ncbi:MAG: PEP-CTERM sorting domain-containing protein [Acidobacteria bacterium]|nr:PEP-CTERM sorting domain-containing protein [Acidobacteriota bacterium]
MRNRAFRPIATILSILLITAVSAQASPVQMGDVVNVVSGSSRTGWQNASTELRLVAQEDRAATPTAAPQDAGATTAEGGAGGIQVQTEEVTEVTAETCECEDIPVAAGGFPKWPFLALIPAVCLTGICTGSNEKCRDRVTNCIPSSPTPPTEVVPEPASLLLFGTGLAALGAGARRRYTRSKKAEKQVAAN